jgi:hypothetical protein
MMSKQDTAQILAVLSAGFPNVTVSKETARVYHEVLGDLEPRDVAEAVSQLLRMSEWFPSAATIRRQALELYGGLAIPTAVAWGLVTKSVVEHGYMKGLQVSDPLIVEAVRMIGWSQVCHSDKPDGIRYQFSKVYDELRKEHDNKIVLGSKAKELDSERSKAIEA